MNPERQPTPISRFETINFNGKLVRDGIYQIMKTEGDNPELVPIEDETHRRNAICQKVLEEYEEFIIAGPESQTDEAGDFLAAWDLFASEVGADEMYEGVFDNFKMLMSERNISFEDAESARRKRAAEHGEFSGLYVVCAVTVTHPDRLVYYGGNEQWQKINTT